MNQLRQAGFYPSISPPQLHIDGRFQHGGPVRTGAALTLTASGGEIWYTTDGSDPRVAGSGGGSGMEVPLVSEESAKRVMVPSGPVADAWRGGADFDDSAWISGAGGVGFERSTGYEPYFQIDLLDAMYGVNSSCYIRIPFEIAASELADLSSLVLKARYDDGFIAYINGVEACRVMFDGSPSWNSSATANHSDLDAVELEPFNVSAALGALRAGPNILAIQGLNAGWTSSDFLISVALLGGQGAGGGTPSGVSTTAVRYDGALTLDKSTSVKARVLSGTTWSALADVVFAVGPVAEGLRISEMMYHPVDPNAEYVELTNVGAETINLNRVRFTRGIDFAFGDIELSPGGYVLVVRDLGVFEATYGVGLPVAGQYGGRLDKAGERIELRDAAGQVIDDFRYRDGWYGLTDGVGFSLTVRDPAASRSLDEKTSWRPSARLGGSPGFDDRGVVPELGAVVINEILAYPGAGQSDWIELHNTTDGPIDVGGWFVSDDGADLQRYEIATGTVIGPGGYLLLVQDETFGNAGDPGCRVLFGLSRDGETVRLHSGVGGDLTGYSVQERFGASQLGVSLGRHVKSTGGYDFVPLVVPTPGAANAAPQVGPVVISEIMYHPAAPDQVQYVELCNISDAHVTLYDEALGLAWRFTDDPDNPEIELPLKGNAPVMLAPGRCLLLVKDLLSFSLTHAVPDDIAVLAWGPGTLSHGGELIEISKPIAAAGDGGVAWIGLDRVAYSDHSHPQDSAADADPWPIEADGQGLSLHRIDPTAYGNDPANWKAAVPSPGIR
jgi:hypothetical protein